MEFHTRREVVRGSGIIGMVGFAGCLGSLRGQANGREGMQIYISEVIANPLGNDDENLNQETVLIEINADTDRDLSGFTLLYSNAQTYNFPDLVSSVPPQSTLQIHSGKEKSSSEEDSKTRFNLFVGSTTSLLVNDGMELTLQDSAGNVVDQISYPGLEPGEVYARPEKN